MAREKYKNLHKKHTSVNKLLAGLSKKEEKPVSHQNMVAAQGVYLQSQINTHFLFNTLSFIYQTANKYSENLGNSVMILSDMMRYAILDTSTDTKVLLEEEIEQIGNLITLHQARFDNKLCLNFTVTGNMAGLTIIPFVLITLVENIFKYADLHSPLNPVHINIVVKSNVLNMEIRNKKGTSVLPVSHGIGLENVRKRLHLYFPKNYDLKINDDHINYHLTLKINLNLLT